MTSKIEFIVKMTCDSCVQAVEKSLRDVDGVNNVTITKETGAVVVETSLPTDRVLSLLETSGRKVRVKGLSGLLAGVSIIEDKTKKIQGVIRFMQVDASTCIIDGTVDGLKSKEHSIHIHECGDLSNGCENVGSLFTLDKSGGNSGDLGTVEVDEKGRANFRIVNKTLNLSDVIGRSVVLEEMNGVRCDKKLACGIIARSAGLFENPKMICACDGVSIWDERNNSKSAL